MSRNPVTATEEREILRLLAGGATALHTARAVDRSPWTIAKVQQEHGIKPGRPGRPSPDSPGLTVEVFEEPEGEGVGKAAPWIPSAGYDVYAPKPHQQQWLALLGAASRAERDRLRSAMCTVLGLAPVCSDDTMVRALVADRRGADELAGRYMAARAAQQNRWPA